MIGGWFIGNFVPTSLKIEGFEVGLKRHTKDEYIEPHFHKIATEYNLVVKGKVVVQGKLYEANDIFVLEPNDVADPVFLEDSDIVVVKVPSIIGDKYTT
jgi:hypothetical protein